MRGLIVVLLAAAASAACAVSESAAAGPLQTAVTDQGEFVGAEAGLAFARVRSTGATVVRLELHWGQVAPSSPGPDATNPANPAYRWDTMDEKLRLAFSHGLQPIVQITKAPAWAQGKPKGAVRPDAVRFRGPFRPSPTAYGQFARAAARRYSGTFANLPRVRLWQAGNEVNVSSELTPQYVGKRPASPAWYRSMLNAFAANVHGVHRDNVVIAAGLSPFTVRNKYVVAVGPLRFMRELLCMSKGKNPTPTCRQRAQFDVWAHHPYTSGGPTRHAFKDDDVSLGDLPEMRRLLLAAVKAGRVTSRQKVRFWVTEFSWDTKPPDPHARAVPIKLHARWVSEALYRMWKAGVSLAAWLQIRDDPYPAFPSQSGLYFRGGASLTRDQPKPALQAFRFPFVAFRTSRGIDVWGRTPTSKPGPVIVEQTSGSGWKRRAVLRANRYGIFSGRIGGVRKSTASSATPRLTSAVASYRDTIIADSPTVYWRLGETSGTVARDESGSSNGTYMGGVRLGVPGALSRDVNRAASFDGRNDRVAVGGVGSPQTVELWIKTEAIRTNPAFSNRNSLHHHVFLGTFGSGNPLVYDLRELQGARWVTDGRWHHLVYTYGGGVGRLYVDGTLDATADWRRVEGGGPAYLGFDPAFGYLRGSIDEVAVYHHALSAAEVKRHFDASGQQARPSDRFQIVGKGTYLRARVGAEASLPFSLTRPPDRYVLPFGGGG